MIEEERRARARVVMQAAASGAAEKAVDLLQTWAALEPEPVRTYAQQIKHFKQFDPWFWERKRPPQVATPPATASSTPIDPATLIPI